MGAKLREPKSGVFWISRETEVVTAKSENRKRFELDCSIPIRDYQKQWFQGLRDRANSGQPFLIVEALTPHEIFEAFEIPFVTNEWWSGIVAYNRQSGYYFDVMEAAGYSRRLEYYPALSLAGAVDNGANPEPAWGGLPQPSLMVYGTSDGPRVELSERIAAVHGIPSFALSVPDTGLPMPARWWETSQRGWEQLSPTWQLDYVSQRYWALIRELEVLADRRLNMDRLREVVDLANHQQQMFDEIRAIIATSLATPIAMPELLGNLLTLQWQRGTSWAAAQATRMRDEIKARADAGHAVCAEERYRLGWVGAGMWQNTGFIACSRKAMAPFSSRTCIFRSQLMDIGASVRIWCGLSQADIALSGCSPRTGRPAKLSLHAATGSSPSGTASTAWFERRSSG